MRDPGLDALVKASRNVSAPSGDARERNRTRLAAQIAAGAATLGVASRARASSPFTGWLAKWTALSVLVSAGVAIGVGVHGTRDRVSTAPVLAALLSTEAVAPPSLATEPAASLEPGRANRAAAPDVSQAAPSASGQTGARAGSVAEARVHKPASTALAGSTVEEPSLERELQLLRSARRAIDSDSPEPALALLDRYAAEFPHGALKPEYQTARVLALCAAGRVASARMARDEFMQQQPGSPLAARLRATCAGAR
jgi:hypothetical protein